MPTTSSVDATGIAEVVMENPPVNALTVAGWFELARMIRDLGDPVGMDCGRDSHDVTFPSNIC